MRHFTKAISIVLLASLSYSQLAWAIDVRQMLVDAENSFSSEDTRRPSVSASGLQASQTQQQAAVDQQNALQDLQNTNFSLTTPGGDVLKYVGDKLSSVQRPDGTELNNITQDVNGNIAGADLKLSDGSVQLYQNGSVIGYQTPDGSQVVYSNGQIQKVFSKTGIETDYTYIKDASGKVIETDLDSASYQSKYDTNGKIKESTRKPDNQKTVYSNGMIQKIIHADGTQESFAWTIQGTDTLVTAQGGAALNTYTDTQGNIFSFDSTGNITQVKLPDNSILTNIAWDAQNKIKDATLTDTANTKYTYQSQVLTKSTDSSGVVTNYTYSSNTITASSGGNTWVYDLNKNPLSFTDLYGNVTTYLTSGAFKGLKDKDTLAAGAVYVYEYTQNPDNSISVQKRQIYQNVYNISVLDGTSNTLLASNNPFLTFDTRFDAGSFSPNVNILATGTGKNLSINLVPGSTGSNFTFNGTTTAMNLTMNPGTTYTAEVRWETGRIGIYVYPKGTARPSTPQGTVSDRSWNVQFKVTAQNAYADYTYNAAAWSWNQQGYIGRNSSSYAQNYTSFSGSPEAVFDILLGDGYQSVSFSAQQYASGVSQTFSTYWVNNSWGSTLTNWNTGAKTSSSVSQILTSGVNYVAEIRVEGSKVNIYVYPKGQPRPAAPTLTFASLAGSVITNFSGYFNGNFAPGRQLYNLTTPAYASSQGTPLTLRTDTLKNLTITKASQPQNAASTVDFSSITYDANSAVKQILLKDGSKLTFTNGLLSQAVDAAGNPTTFSFSQSALSNLTGSEITQNNLTSDYDASGKLSQVKVNGLAIKYKSDGTGVDSIQKSDGTNLSNLVFDASGNITGAAITTPDGQTRTYSGGKLVDLRQADQSEILYSADKPLKLITPEKITYNFDYTNPAVIQAVIDPLATPDALTPVKMVYDQNFSLQKVIRQNQDIINYLGNQVSSIQPASGSGEVFNYIKDANGNILSYTVTQSNVITTYDASNNPIQVVISPTANNPHTFNVTYQYGKIRQITKDGVVTLNYTYTFDANNNELTNIDDLGTNTFKVYQGGNLISSLDKATCVLSSYFYTNGQASQVQVTRLGLQFHTYNYSYDGANTVVTDEEGTIRTYDAGQKLVYLEKNGQKFAYSQVTQQVATGASNETVLPVGLYDTTAQSVLAWDGSKAWFSWEKPYGKDYLVTYWQDQWVEYKPAMTQAGDLKISLEAINDGALPANYPNFQLDVSIDGQSQGLFNAAASAAAWQTATILLKNVTAGQHTVRIKWINQVSDASGNRSNFKFRNISMKQEVPVFTSQQVVTENLIQQKLSDGSIAKYDAAGKVTQIDTTDGTVLKNIVTDANGAVTQAVAVLSSGVQQIFSSGAVTDQILPDGTHLYYQNGQLSKALDPAGNALTYSYDKDAQGNILGVFVRTGNANLRYDLGGNLLGLKLDGVLTPAQVAAQTSHSYQGSGTGANSIDGNFGTWQYENTHMQTGASGTVISEHDFPSAQTVTSITFDMYAFGNTGQGSYVESYIGSSYEANYDVEVLVNGQWQQVSGSYAGVPTVFNKKGSAALSSGVVTLNNLNLANVTAIRAYAHGMGTFSSYYPADGGAGIYEIQWTLADQTNLNFSKTTNAQGQTTGYSFAGYPGSINFDAQGNFLPSTAPALSSIGQSLSGKTSYFGSMPNKTNLTIPANSGFAAWINLAASALLDPQSVITQEYSTDGTLQTETNADGATTLFDNNKPSEVLDAQGNILVQDTYDANGNPTRVYLKNARDTLPDEVLKAKQSIEDQRSQSLMALAQQKNLAYQSIQQQVADEKAALNAQMASLQDQFNQVANTSASGKAAKSQRGDVLNQIGHAMDDTRVELANLDSQEADGYASLDASVKAVSDKIEADAQSAYAALAAQQANMQNQILQQEVSPIVYDYYRRILGRDPDTNEYNYWVGKIDYAAGNTPGETKTTNGVNLTAALNTYISALPEFSDRQAYVSTIKTNVTAAVNSYLSMTDAQKQAYAATLGLTAQDLITLSASDAQKILTWLNSRSLHFGQSAFLALESLLDQKGISYTRTDLAQKAVMADILSGVMTPLDDGDPVLSMFALKKAAGTYGLSLDAAQINFDDLLSLYANTPQSKVVTLVNSSHFVVITAVTATTVTYLDTGAGKDKQNQSFTVAKSDFLKIWSATRSSADPSSGGQGNVLLETQKIQSQNLATKVLSASQQKSLRGACWFVFVFIFTAVANIGTAVWAAVNAIGTIIAAVGTVVANTLTAVGQALSSLGQGLSYIGQSLFEGIKFAASTVFNAGKQLFGSFLQQSVVGGGTQASFSNVLFQNAVKTGFSVATSKGLEVLGVNPTVANLASAFVSGGVPTGSAAQFTMQSFIQNGLKAMALQGGQTIIQNTTMDTSLKQALSLVVAPLVDGIQSGNIGGNLVKIVPQMAKDLSLYGLDKLGTSLGLDPKIASTIASPIASAIGASFKGGANAGQNIIQAVQAGLTQGVVAYGLDFVGNSSPILGSLLSPDIQKNIEIAVGRDGLFQGIFNVLKNTISNAFNVVGGVVQNVTQGITNFASIVQQKGLVGALQSYLNAIFSRSAQESILSQGGLQNILNTVPKTAATLPDGKSAQELKINAANSIYLDASGNAIGFKKDGAITEGSFGVDASGDFALTAGQAASPVTADLNLSATVKDGQATQIVIKDLSGDVVMQADPEKANTPIYIEGPSPDASPAAAPSFDFWGAVFKVMPLALSLFVEQGAAYAGQVVMDSSASMPINQITNIALLNGIRLFDAGAKGTIPPYFDSGNPFRTTLNTLGVADNSIKAIPLYGELLKDPFLYFDLLKVTKDIEDVFVQINIRQPGKPFVPLAYSGGAEPLLLALSDPLTHYYDYGVQTAILIGAPFNPNDDTDIIKTSSLNTIINVYGTDDVFNSQTDSTLPHILHQFTSTQHPLETINIELKDISHTEYFYQTGDNPTPEQVKASNFIASLTQASLTDQALTSFLTLIGTPNIQTYTDPSTGITHTIRTFVVDTKNLPNNF